MWSTSFLIRACAARGGESLSVTAIPVETNIEQPPDARLRSLWRLATVNGKVTVGLLIIGFFVLVALFGPLFITGDANAFGSDVSASPALAHPLGTTSYGQDVLA